MSKSIRLWVGVDAEWRAVINQKGRESRDKEVEDKEKDKDIDRDRKVRDGKYAKIQEGAATLQVCTILLPLPLLLPFLHLSLYILLTVLISNF